MSPSGDGTTARLLGGRWREARGDGSRRTRTLVGEFVTGRASRYGRAQVWERAKRGTVNARKERRGVCLSDCLAHIRSGQLMGAFFGLTPENAVHV